ncbi:uncharacterized protein LOC123513991 isoform X1 [Portunus trituberculatus]|uniref:uncharacterized protein LOC123513991 isoform X1 n=1 Tax=Portunus trituberculatus TaxID=210409 RepID=UPI001E1CF536|nr:uncharacterized protein LOC123513991 isoform X1 [Portunus trituberculatus]
MRRNDHTKERVAFYGGRCSTDEENPTGDEILCVDVYEAREAREVTPGTQGHTGWDLNLRPLDCGLSKLHYTIATLVKKNVWTNNMRTITTAVSRHTYTHQSLCHSENCSNMTISTLLPVEFPAPHLDLSSKGTNSRVKDAGG